MKNSNGGGTKDERVVYRRTPGADEDSAPQNAFAGTPLRFSLAPALGPLVFGFLILLGLVIALGLLSVRRLESGIESVNSVRDYHSAQWQTMLQIEVEVAR